MENRGVRIDLMKLVFYILKRMWIIVICGIIGFAALYIKTAYFQVDTYTASGTMYVYNGNPNTVNYQYTSSNDLNSAVQLIDTYMVVIKSNKVMDVVAERLAPDYPGINPKYIAATLSAGSVSETGVLQVQSTTGNAQMSTDIVNAVMDVAPAEIIRVVSAGSIEIIDYAEKPLRADARFPRRRGVYGALCGVVLAGGLLLILFLMDGRITDAKELTDNYTPPVLSSIQRDRYDEKKEKRDPSSFLLNKASPMEKIEGFAKLRMNMLFTLVGKEHQVVVITSPISGEGKTTISANLAISCAQGGKNVLLIDGDMRRACLRDIFHYDKKSPGLSDILIGRVTWPATILGTEYETLHILPTGQLPPNPAELLSSKEMEALLTELEQNYDLILIDMPPVNVVADPLVISALTAGCLFVARQNYTDNRDLRKALISAEMTGMNVLGFVFYGEDILQGSYYGYRYGRRYYRKYYKNYYSKYDNRVTSETGKQDDTGAQL